MAMIQALGKPKECHKFEDLSKVFELQICNNFRSSCTRVDVVFDTYKEESIKSGTRDKRSQGKTAVVKQIDHGGVKLPYDWKTYLSVNQNKVNLSQFLSCEILKSQNNHDIVVAGGFENPEVVVSNTERNVKRLYSNHEEADTRILLHIVEARDRGYQRIIVQCRDTDVLVLLVAFYPNIGGEIWFKCGTSKEPCYVAIHNITLTEEVREALVPFHVITGCDTTSQLMGIGKKSAWKVFKDCPELLTRLGQDEVVDNNILENAEKFICKLYQPSTTFHNIHDVRCNVFRKTKANLDNLPPTQDALKLHIRRSHYQAHIWKQALLPNQVFPRFDQSGWKVEDGVVKPIFMTLDPVSEGFVEITSCSCGPAGFRCRTKHCSCTKSGLMCTNTCVCTNYCLNPHAEHNSEDEQ